MTDDMPVPGASLLHRPARADHLLDLGEHLSVVEGVSRALWVLLADYPLTDPRDRNAVRSLADVLADHASAAAMVADLAEAGRK